MIPVISTKRITTSHVNLLKVNHKNKTKQEKKTTATGVRNTCPGLVQ